MIRMMFLAILLAGFWLLLSGHYTPLLLSFGAVSVALVLLLVYRMDVIDREDSPVVLRFTYIFYLGWLTWEVIKSNIDVAWRILHPGLPISPTLFEVEGTQKTEMGRVIYANSITLTPGTVTADLNGNRFLIHALTRSGAESLVSGDMDRRVSAYERG